MDTNEDRKPETLGIDEACVILGFERWTQVNRNSLKRNYYTMALKHHPDKGGDEEVFKQIKNAHELLEQMLDYQSTDQDETGGDSSRDSYRNYQGFLNQVIHQWLQGQCPTPLMNEILQGIQKMSLSLFETMDTESVQHLYHFLANFCDYEKHFPDFMKHLRELIEKEGEGGLGGLGRLGNKKNVFLVHPTLDDLFENNVYAWDYEGHKYFVPLWHHDLVFDNKNEDPKELHVSCVPDLPENVFIDEKNHIYVHINVPLNNDLLVQEDLDVWLGKRCFKIPVKSLLVKKEQWYIMKKKGISMISDNKNIYTMTEKSNLYFHIIFL
jgi:hypothetical protein